MIASCSFEKGIEHIKIFNKAINADDFIKYLKEILKQNKGKIAIFLDNLRVHRAFDVFTFYEDKDITPLFNIAYSPEFNGIESVFS